MPSLVKQLFVNFSKTFLVLEELLCLFKHCNSSHDTAAKAFAEEVEVLFIISVGNVKICPQRDSQVTVFCVTRAIFEYIIRTACGDNTQRHTAVFTHPHTYLIQ